MASDLLSDLADEKMEEMLSVRMAELRAKIEAEIEANYLLPGYRKGFQEGFQQGMRQLHIALQEIIASRFPEAPLILCFSIQRITDPVHIQPLFIAAIQAANLDEFQRHLARASINQALDLS